MKMSRDINTEMDEIGDEILILHLILFQFIHLATKVKSNNININNE